VTEPARRRLTRDERRAQLLAIGRRQVERTSFDGLSTDVVADEAGISRGLLFHYFPSRDAYVVALAEDAARELLEVTDPDPDLPPLARLRQGLAAYVDYVVAHRGMYLALIRGASGGKPEMQAVFERTRGALAERVLEGLGEDPAAAAPTLRLVARGYIAFVEEVVVAWLREPDPSPDAPALLATLEAAGASLVAAAGVPPERLTGGS
jgi:AcrR family transcriptional regulator